VWSEDGGSYQQGHGYGAFDDDELDAAGPYRSPHEADFRGLYSGNYPGYSEHFGSRAASRQPSQRGLGPLGDSRSDARVREQVCDALTRHDGVDARDVEVAVQNGEVTLTGSVPERSMKRAAEDAAESCRGVSDVHNRLRVLGHPSQQDRPR
jgi:BON domain-containing protein